MGLSDAAQRVSPTALRHSSRYTHVQSPPHPGPGAPAPRDAGSSAAPVLSGPGASRPDGSTDQWMGTIRYFGRGASDRAGVDPGVLEA